MQEKGNPMKTQSKQPKPLSASAEAPDSPFLPSSEAVPGSTFTGPFLDQWNQKTGEFSRTVSRPSAVRRDYKPARSVPATSRQFFDLLEAITEKLSQSSSEQDRSLGRTLSETLRLYEVGLEGGHGEEWRRLEAGQIIVYGPPWRDGDYWNEETDPDKG